MTDDKRTIWIKTPADWLGRDDVIAVGLAGRALYLAAQLHSAQQLTDGRVTRTSLAVLGAQAGVADAAAAAALLEEHGLWVATPTGWQDADYLAHNWSRERYEGYVAQRRANGGKGGRPRKQPAAPVAQENHDANHLGYHHANQDANHDANQTGTNDLTKTKPRLRDRDRDRDRDRPGEGRGDRERDLAPETREGADARAIVQLREGQGPTKDFLRGTFKSFKSSYPKGVPDHVKEIWAEHCYDEASFHRILEGLNAWKASRTWSADGNDFVTAPRTFLEERLYLYPPLGWTTDGPAPEPPPPPPAPSYAARQAAEAAAQQRRLATLLTPIASPGLDAGEAEPRPALEARYEVRRAGP